MSIKEAIEAGYRYIASATEFHSLRRHKPECNVDEIVNPTFFKKGKDAIAAKRDACGNCSIYWKSKKNRK